jgi:hypothetical protein
MKPKSNFSRILEKNTDLIKINYIWNIHIYGYILRKQISLWRRVFWDQTACSLFDRDTQGRWRPQVPTRSWYLFTKRQCLTSQKPIILILTSTETSSLSQRRVVLFIWTSRHWNVHTCLQIFQSEVFTHREANSNRAWQHRHLYSLWYILRPLNMHYTACYVGFEVSGEYQDDSRGMWHHVTPRAILIPTPTLLAASFILSTVPSTSACEVLTLLHYSTTIFHYRTVPEVSLRLHQTVTYFIPSQKGY